MPKEKSPRPTVLVLARETVIAALLGLLLELDGYQPAFPQPDERPEDALARLRPPLVILLDGELEAVRSDLFFVRAAKARARVVLFSPPHAFPEVRRIAGERGLRAFELPVDRATLRHALRHVVDDDGVAAPLGSGGGHPPEK